MTFNRTLTWKNHIFTVIGKVYGMLRSLWTTQYFTPTKIRLLLAKTYLLPTMLYGCELYANCDTTCNRKLNVLFNNIARYIFGIKRRDHISEHAIKIYSISFNNYLKLKTLTQLHKILVNQDPSYLYERFQATRSARSSQLLYTTFNSKISERHFLCMRSVYGILYLWRSGA